MANRSEPNRKELNPINYNNATYNGDEDDACDDSRSGYYGEDEEATSRCLIYISLSPTHSHASLFPLPEPLYTPLVIHLLSRSLSLSLSLSLPLSLFPHLPFHLPPCLSPSLPLSLSVPRSLYLSLALSLSLAVSLFLFSQSCSSFMCFALHSLVFCLASGRLSPFAGCGRA